MDAVGIFLTILIMGPIFLPLIYGFIRIAFVYWSNYIYTRISYKKDPREAERRLGILEYELHQFVIEESSIAIRAYFGTGPRSTRDYKEKEKLTWAVKGCEKAIQRSLRK